MEKWAVRVELTAMVGMRVAMRAMASRAVFAVPGMVWAGWVGQGAAVYVVAEMEVLATTVAKVASAALQSHGATWQQ